MVKEENQMETTVVLNQKKSLHELLKPKIQNMIKFTEEALEKEGAPEAVKRGYKAEFQQLYDHEDKLEVFVAMLMQHWKSSKEEGKCYLDIRELDAYQEEAKKVASSSLAEWMPGITAQELENARECLNYDMWPEHKDHLRRYFTCFCSVKSLEKVDVIKECCK